MCHASLSFVLNLSKEPICEKRERRDDPACKPHILWGLPYSADLPDVFCRGMGPFYAGRRLSL